MSKGLLAHGVTSFCPTLVTSPTDTYHQVLPKIKRKAGGRHGATILGVHVEGPFISVEKKGAHPENCIRDLEEGFKTLEDVYGDISNISIVTLAPEKLRVPEVIGELARRGVTVSVGHSMADLKHGEIAVKHGATLITHLFNAMLPVSHSINDPMPCHIFQFSVDSFITEIRDLLDSWLRMRFHMARLSISVSYLMAYTLMVLL